MNKFKIGDKLVVTVASAWGLVGTEGIITNIHEGVSQYKITGGNLDNFYIKIGKKWNLNNSEFKLINEVEKKEQKQLPLCYAEIQKEKLDDHAKALESIEDDLCPSIGGVSFKFDGENFKIEEYTLTKEEAKALKKWLTKMTATPKKKTVKKAVKKVSKKKAKAVK